MAGSTATQTRLVAERRGGVLILALDGPAIRNALGILLYDRFIAEMAGAAADAEVRVVVLTGAGGYFCSGGNVKGLRDSASATLAKATAGTDKLNEMINAIVDCPKPVIAAVEGGAAGAGVGVVLASDMIVASVTAKFTVAHVRVGLGPDGGVTHFLRSALPRQLVMEMCLLGQPVPAQRLQEAGVINTVTAEGKALEAALALADRLAAGPQNAMANIKALINAAPQSDLRAHLEAEALALNLARFGPEAAEGLSAFLEKRKPDFTGTGPGKVR